MKRLLIYVCLVILASHSWVAAAELSTLDAPEPSTDWAPFWTVVAVGFTALCAWGIRLWERRHERLALKAAIFAEISATIEISDRRKHIELAKDYIKRFRAGEDINMPRIGDAEVMAQDIIKNFPVFYANVGNIGILGADTAANIAKFYTQNIGIGVTLHYWALGSWDNATPTDKADAVADELALWEETRALGLKLCKRSLSQTTPSPAAQPDHGAA